MGHLLSAIMHVIVLYLPQDPESMDALRDTNVAKTLPRKDDVSTTSPLPSSKQGGKFKPFSSSKAEPTFKSFLTGNGSSGNQEAITESSPAPIARSYVPKS